MENSDVKGEKSLVAKCGLYCGACGAFKKGRCIGCAPNTEETWCKVHNCCNENGFATCADCRDFPDPMECKMYNSFMARIFGFIFKSDRAACIAHIKEVGLDAHAQKMAEENLHSIKKK